MAQPLGRSTAGPRSSDLLQRSGRGELDYRLRKELWAAVLLAMRIAVRFEYEFHDATGQWHRAYGNENWEFAANGLMQRRYASIDDVLITEADRKFRWERPSRRPDSNHHPFW
jgi:nuclear transport factor 2 (NTF2) superfamily protein